MSLRFFRLAAIIFLLAIVAAVVCLKLIHRIVIVQQPTPSPTPSATPAGIYVPKKTMEVAKLFSGITINSTVDTEKGLTAEMERDDPSSYTLNLELKVRVPKPNTDLLELQKLNKNLPKALPWLEAALPKAKVSPFYDDFYRLKVNSLTRDLPRLEQLISRQHFFDCETALEFESASKRHALLIQAAMEVDTDGSDSDRVPVVDSNSSTFQPITSYKWPKKTEKENPFLAAAEERVRKITQELATHPAADRARDLNSALPDARDEVIMLKKFSFLIGADDPFIVVPLSLMSSDYGPYAPKIGDYCVVIYDQTLYPAIIGDAGPNYKIGEASLRICKEINILSNANNRPVSELKITYLIFPNTADPKDAPDLDKWRARCDALLNEMGGYGGELKTWVDLTKPKPTPTPAPTPSSSPSVSPSPAGSPSPGGSPSASPSPGAPSSPAPMSSPSVSPSTAPSTSPTTPPPASTSPSASASATSGTSR